MAEFLSIKKEWHSASCACELDIDWNITQITGSDMASGYIVQEFSRTQTPSNILGVSEYEDIHYFEAWRIKDGDIIPEDKGALCDDMFCIGNSFNDFSTFQLSIDTKGCFEFNGTVYWIPEGSSYFEIIHGWSRTEVKQAAGLKASYTFSEIKNIDYVFKRDPFVHSWDLIGEKNIYSKALVKAFRYCPNNTKRDRELLSTCVSDLFGEKYNCLKYRIIDEWEQQWLNTSQDQEDRS